MTATVHHMPARRLALDWPAIIADADDVVRNPHLYDNDVVRDACLVLQGRGDWMQITMADAMMMTMAREARRLSDAELIAGGADMRPASTGLIREAIKLAIIVAMGLAFYVVTP